MHRLLCSQIIKFSSKKSAGSIASQIIKGIAYGGYNRIITEASLRQSLLKKIKEEGNQNAKEKLVPLFQGGVVLPEQVFYQQRIVDGSSRQKVNGESKLKTVFCPTMLVAEQVFKRCLQSEIKQPQLFYGQFGTSKSFSFMLYALLSNAVYQAALEDKIKIEQMVPKLFYYSINPEKIVKEYDKYFQSDKIVKEEKEILQSDKRILKDMAIKHLRISLNKQCPKLSNDQYQIINWRKHEKLWKQKGIQTILLVDQINRVASAYRKKQNQQQFSIKQQACVAMNYARESIHQYFSKVLYNSSYNFEYYDRQIMEKVNLNNQEPHSSFREQKCKNLKYIERFAQNKENTTQEIADIILFVLEQKVKQQQRKSQRKQQLNIMLATNDINDSATTKTARKIVYHTLFDNKQSILISYIFVRTALSKQFESISALNDFQQAAKSINSFEAYLKKIVNLIIQSAKKQYRDHITRYLRKNKKTQQIKKFMLAFIFLNLPQRQFQNPEQIKQFSYIKNNKFCIDQNKLMQQLKKWKIKDNIKKNIDSEDPKIQLISIEEFLDRNLFMINNNSRMFESVFDFQQLTMIYGQTPDQNKIQRYAQFIEYCDGSCFLTNVALGSILETTFALQTLNSKDLIIRVSSQKSIQINDKIIGFYPFNKDSKQQRPTLIQRLQEIDKQIQKIASKGSFLAFPVLKGTPLDIKKEQIYDKIRWNSYRVDFMLIEKDNEQIPEDPSKTRIIYRIHMFDITCSQQQINKKKCEFESFYNENFLKQSKIMIVNEKEVRVELYLYVVGPCKTFSSNQKKNQGILCGISQIPLRQLIAQNNGEFLREAFKKIGYKL